MKLYTNAGACISINGQDALGTDKGRDYECDVAGTLDTIQCSRVGRLVVQSLRRSLTIIPYGNSVENASATPNDINAAGVKGRRQYVKGAQQVRNGVALLYSKGGGSNSTIGSPRQHFRPQALRTGHKS